MPRNATLHLALWSMHAVVLGLLAGCDEQADSRITIDFWALGREGELVQELVGDFEREHPELHVRVQQVPWSAAHEKLLTAYAGNAMPDVFQLGNTWLPEFAAIGALADLGPALEASPVVQKDDFFAGILKTNEFEGTLWGLPWYVDTRLIFYRPDILQRAGYTEFPQTWTDWLQAMRRTKAILGADGHAILLPIIDPVPLVVLALQKGSGLLREDHSYADFGAAPFREALDFYLGIFRQDLAPTAGSGQMANLYQEFGRGRFAMFMSGPWNIGELERRLPEPEQSPWTTAPMPAPEPNGPGSSLAGGASLVIHRDSPDRSAAWKLVEFLAASQQQLRFYHSSGNLPAHKEAWEIGGLIQDSRVASFWRQLHYLSSSPPIPEWEQIAQTLGRYCEALVREEMTVEEALRDLEEDVNLILEKRRWLAGRMRELDACRDDQKC